MCPLQAGVSIDRSGTITTSLWLTSFLIRQPPILSNALVPSHRNQQTGMIIEMKSLLPNWCTRGMHGSSSSVCLSKRLSLQITGMTLPSKHSSQTFDQTRFVHWRINISSSTSLHKYVKIYATNWVTLKYKNLRFRTSVGCSKFGNIGLPYQHVYMYMLSPARSWAVTNSFWWGSTHRYKEYLRPWDYKQPCQ